LTKKTAPAPLLAGGYPPLPEPLPPPPAAPPPPAVIEEPTAVSMFERLAKDPSVDVEKLERLIQMQERIMRHNAKSAFDSAFAQMQAALPEITERGQIAVKGIVRSTYAKLEDIHAAIKPVLKAHGFAIRHRTEWPDDRTGIIRIVGILSHEQGHAEESVFEAPLDRSEYRTDIQSMGSTVSYGRRYTTLDLLNITTRGADDDGQAGGGRPPEPVPHDFEKFISGLEEAAMQGTPALMTAFNKAAGPLRTYLTMQHPARWNACKDVAKKASAASTAQVTPRRPTPPTDSDTGRRG